MVDQQIVDQQQNIHNFIWQIVFFNNFGKVKSQQFLEQ